MRPFIPAAYRPETYLPVHDPGHRPDHRVRALTLLGFLTANLVGRTLVELGESILNRMPIVRPIYKSLKQIFETLFSKTGSSFRQVGAGGVSGARDVVAGVPLAAAERRHRGNACRRPSTSRPSCPARPTRPPASSSTCRARDMIELDITVEAAMTLLMSAGMVQPGSDRDQQRKLAALAETAGWRKQPHNGECEVARTYRPAPITRAEV